MVFRLVEHRVVTHHSVRLVQAMVLGSIEGPSLVAASRHLPMVSRRPQPRFIDGVVHVSFMASVRHKVLKFKHTYLLSCIRCTPPSSSEFDCAIRRDLASLMREVFLDGEVLPRVPPRALACWLLVFLMCVFMDPLPYERAPDPFGVEERWQWRGLAAFSLLLSL